ncbi:hypothetical protein EV426DRAFT_164401 [Tirmania nivea]|nr:hypothetical protein EV426DRAFT_164401 [Tirmania nivea]
MPTTRRSAGRPRKGGNEPQRVQAPSPVIDQASESMTAATPATQSLASGDIVNTTRAAAQVPVPIDVPIAPELLMQDAEAQTATASVQTAEAAQEPRVNEDEESEWEYDWDDCETHYITLDLTIPQPLFPHLAPTTVLPNATSTTAPKGKKPANKSSVAAAADDDDDNNTSANKNKTAKPNPSTTTQYPTRFQLQALPSLTPLVSYHNRIFSCDWTVSLGSEIFITSKEKSSNEGAQPEVEIVGVGQARLHGHPAIVTARSRTEDHRTTRTDAPGKGGGQLAAGKGGMSSRTAFWKRLEEVKRRKREAGGIVNPAERDRRDGQEDEEGEGERGGEGEGEIEMEGAETDFGEEGLERARGSSSHGGTRGTGKGVGRGRGRRRKEVIGHEQEIRQLEEMERDLDLEEMNIDVEVDEDDDDDEYGDEDEEAERIELERRRRGRGQEGRCGDGRTDTGWAVSE